MGTYIIDVLVGRRGGGTGGGGDERALITVGRPEYTTQHGHGLHVIQCAIVGDTASERSVI